MSVLHTVEELVAAVGPTYRAIDIRSMAVFRDKSWVNVISVVRFTYEDVQTARARLKRLSERFPTVQTPTLRFQSVVRPFEEWPDLCLEVKMQGILRMEEDLVVDLRQRLDLRTASGFFQSCYSEIRSFDGIDWPGLRTKFDAGGLTPLADGELTREIHLLGYSDAFEAANALCELNVSPQNHGCYLSLSVPVFGTISDTRISTADKRIEIDVKRHNDLGDLKAIVCVRAQSTLVDAPFREHLSTSDFSEAGQHTIRNARCSVELGSLNDDDWVQVRLVHPKIGELKRVENYARMFMLPADRNILHESLKLFCEDAELDHLLIRAYNAKAPRLNESAGFELHVAWLLGLFGFSTAVLGQYEKIVAPDTSVRRATVDILASVQRLRILLVVACTLNPPKQEDFGNLRYARDILSREVLRGTAARVFPVLFTSATGCPSYDRAEGTFDLVPVVDGDAMKSLLAVLRSGYESRFFEFLANPNLCDLTVGRQP
jgi:hypothetical protein